MNICCFFVVLPSSDLVQLVLNGTDSDFMGVFMKNYLFLSIVVVVAAFFYSGVLCQKRSGGITSSKKTGASLSRLYKKRYAKPVKSLLTSTSVPSKLSGKWAKSSVSRPFISRFIKAYNINVDEIEKPIRSYRTFNDFFIRKLKPGARPIAKDPTAIVSPADGNLLVVPNLHPDTPLSIKATTFSVEKMVQDSNLAQMFEGGVAVIVRIAPDDYHRVHFPIDGIPGVPRVITGRYETVNPIAHEVGIQPLTTNVRHVIEFNSDKASKMAIVLVGALLVGAIVETYQPGVRQRKSNEMGYYEYGGSTIVLLFQKDTVVIDSRFIEASKIGEETSVKMGQVIGHVITYQQEQHAPRRRRRFG